MAVGFTPKHLEEHSFTDLSPQEALALIVKAAEKLNWSVSYLSRNGIKAYTQNGMFQWEAEITVRLKENTLQIKSESAGNDMVDWGKNKKTVHAFKTKFDELKPQYSREELHMEFLLLEEALVPDSEDELILPPATKIQQLKDILSLFKPVRGFLSTPILLDLNILIFILMVISGAGIFSPDNEHLLNWGANFKPYTLEGEWWRLITSCFVHIGIIHLVFNMYALIYIGAILEPLLGSMRFMIAYLLTGLVASMTSLWWHDYSVSAGASGAIFGMYGVFFALISAKLIEKDSNKSLFVSIAVFVGYNLLFGISIGADNAAHIGGLISGFLVGYGLIPGLLKADNKLLSSGSLIALAAITIALSAFVYTRLPNDIGTYQKKIDQFVLLEEQALKVLDLTTDTPKDKQLSTIRQGIKNWKDAKDLIVSCGELNLPEAFVSRNKKLVEYSQLRILSYESVYKMVDSNSESDRLEYEAYNQRIKAKLDELKNEK